MPHTQTLNQKVLWNYCLLVLAMHCTIVNNCSLFQNKKILQRIISQRLIIALLTPCLVGHVGKQGLATAESFNHHTVLQNSNASPHNTKVDPKPLNSTNTEISTQVFVQRSRSPERGLPEIAEVFPTSPS